MRGIQRTNADGVATFKTVYPGWYPGRTVHIHVKVHVRGNVVHTGQLYFSDRVTDAVYRRKPYSNRPNRETRNADDSLFRDGGKRSLLQLRRSGTGYVGSIRMGVRRSAPTRLDRRAARLRQDVDRDPPRSAARPSLVRLRIRRPVRTGTGARPRWRPLSAGSRFRLSARGEGAPPGRACSRRRTASAARW